MFYLSKRIFIINWLVTFFREGFISQRGYLSFTGWKHCLVKVLSLKDDIYYSDALAFVTRRLKG